MHGFFGEHFSRAVGIHMVAMGIFMEGGIGIGTGLDGIYARKRFMSTWQDAEIRKYTRAGSG